jgi:hypothetical protein
MAHELALDPQTWPREDIPGLGLIDEDVDLLWGGVCDNLFSGSPSLKTPKLSVLGLKRWVTDQEVLPGCA